MNSGHNFAGLIPEKLVQRIREQKCVLFVGAGLSSQARTSAGEHLPTWRPLLTRMLEWCQDNRVPLRAEAAEIEEVLSKGRLLVVAQELQECIGTRLGACLSEILHSGDTTPSDAHSALYGCPWTAILTTNYDALIEGAYALRSGGVLPPVFSASGLNQALNALREGRLFVFKLHGDLSTPDSIVLGDRDYSRLLHMSPAYRSFLETVFASYTVLFVGFGAQDPDLDAVVDRLSALYERSIGQHYLLIADGVFTTLERRRLLEDKRLDCIPYTKDSGHTQVGEFLRALKIRCASDDEISTPFESDVRPRAFISGAYSEIELLRRVAAIAEESGFETWFADTQVQVGDKIVDRIGRAIDDTDCMIVVMSEASSGSSWVHFEIGRAWGAHKTIFPIRVGNTPVPSDLAGFLYLQLASPSVGPAEDAKIREALGHLCQKLQADKRNAERYR